MLACFRAPSLLFGSVLNFISYGIMEVVFGEAFIKLAAVKTHIFLSLSVLALPPSFSPLVCSITSCVKGQQLLGDEDHWELFIPST